MSEKRFGETERNCYYTSLVFDNQTQEELGTDKVVDLLNEQQATIKYLTIEKHTDKRFQTIIAELKKENEQLRHEIEIEKKWQLAQDRYYVKIKEENEQLRKELDNFKPIMFNNMQKGTIILYSKGDIDE